LGHLAHPIEESTPTVDRYDIASLKPLQQRIVFNLGNEQVPNGHSLTDGK
jgi:hypothetical protein